MTAKPDFHLKDRGADFVLCPTSEPGKHWLHDHTDRKTRLHVERHDVIDMINTIRHDGLRFG